MLRTSVLCCAVAGIVCLTVGCNLWSDSKEAAGSRDQMVAGYKTKLDEMDRKLADLKDRSEKAAGEEKPKLEAKLKEATAKRDAFKKEYEELKAAPADKVEAEKKETQTALDEFQKAIE
jgi:hypothetical protein